MGFEPGQRLTDGRYELRECGLFGGEIPERAFAKLAERGLGLIEKGGPALVERFHRQGLKGILHRSLGPRYHFKFSRRRSFRLRESGQHLGHPHLSLAEPCFPLFDTNARGRQFALKHGNPLSLRLEAGPVGG